MRTLTTLLASVVLTFGAASAMAQEISAPAAPAKTRAEVRADLEMFHRAGLSHVSPAGQPRLHRCCCQVRIGFCFASGCKVNKSLS